MFEGISTNVRNAVTIDTHCHGSVSESHGNHYKAIAEAEIGDLEDQKKAAQLEATRSFHFLTVGIYHLLKSIHVCSFLSSC